MTKTALIVIDVQKGLADPSHGERNNPDAESNIARLLAAWRERGLPIVHVQHSSVRAGSLLRPELPGHEFKDEVRPAADEFVFKKTVNSAFIGTGLEDHLRRQQITALVAVGLTTDHCVASSVRMASDLGFRVTLVSDATAAFERVGGDGVHYTGEQIHRINVVSLEGEFCDVQTTDSVLELRLSGSSRPFDHDR